MSCTASIRLKSNSRTTVWKGNSTGLQSGSDTHFRQACNLTPTRHRFCILMSSDVTVYSLRPRHPCQFHLRSDIGLSQKNGSVRYPIGVGTHVLRVHAFESVSIYAFHSYNFAFFVRSVFDSKSKHHRPWTFTHNVQKF